MPKLTDKLIKEVVESLELEYYYSWGISDIKFFLETKIRQAIEEVIDEAIKSLPEITEFPIPKSNGSLAKTRWDGFNEGILHAKENLLKIKLNK